MNCVDCEVALRTNRPAIAACQMCGAGLCADHALSSPRRTTQTVAGTRATRAKAAAPLFCTACAILIGVK